MPISGRKRGKVPALSVTRRFSIVWLATCPRLSPLIRQAARVSFAIMLAAFIMHMRKSIVDQFAGPFCFMRI